LGENTDPPSKADMQGEHHRSTAVARQTDAAQKAQSYIEMKIPDLEVIDQYGKRMRFYTDLVKGKVVVINFIYTTCTYVCPMQGATFSRLQSALGDRIGKDVYLISVSTDPLTDTSAKLKAWGERFKAKQGWRLVTGAKTQMDKLLLALTGDSARTGEHSAIAIIGSDDRGRWVRTYGLEGPERMIEIIDSIVNRPSLVSLP
jgi:protein SCO1/2